MTGAGSGPERVLCDNRTDGTFQVRDVATGGLVRAVSIDWPTWVASVVDGDVIAAGVDGQGFAVARRWDVQTGAVVWSYHGEVPLTLVDQSLGLEVGPSAVTVTVGPTSVHLDIAGGTEMPAGAVTVRSSTELAGGLRGIQEGSGPSTEHVRVVAANGTELLSTPGVLQIPQVDDGSMPGLAFVEDLAVTGPLRAIDVHTGQELWSSDGTSPVALVEGRLVTWNNSGDVSVLDARTGDVLWSYPVYTTDSSVMTPVTDGDKVLTIENDSGQTSLVARTLTTGAVVWAKAWDPADGTSLYVLPTGTVLAFGQARITALTP
jgi:outer membrane protein assembly factor BamB